MVTEAIAKQLAADGYEVTRIGEAWDPRSGSVPSVDSDLSGMVTSQSLERNLKERFRAAIAQVPLVQGLEPSTRGL